VSKRLWEKGEGVKDEVLAFTVGNDTELDLRLVKHDTIASAAHARMLGQIGVLSKEEVLNLINGLSEVYQASEKGEFSIAKELEDCHAAIEAFLVDKVGDAGKKIHTGRSRNDQVLVALRLFMRSEILEITEQLVDLTGVIVARADEEAKVEMPGYTHMQAAMPTSVGVWLSAYSEWGLELIKEAGALSNIIDRNPLGAASGFGVPLKLDREKTASLLGFKRAQRNPIDVQNSRGRYELKLVRWLVDVGQMVEKFAWDMLLYSTAEFGFFSLPVDLTTGSSIMPQKHNPDVLELMRAKVSKLRAAQSELEWVTGKLPSHYHRDFQLTKEPLFAAVDTARELISIFLLVVKSFHVNKEALELKQTPELYATYAAYKKVADGAAFRDAYKETADDLKAGKINPKDFREEFEIAVLSSFQESQVDAKADLKKHVQSFNAEKTRLDKIETEIFKAKPAWGKRLFGA